MLGQPPGIPRTEGSATFGRLGASSEVSPTPVLGTPAPIQRCRLSTRQTRKVSSPLGQLGKFMCIYAYQLKTMKPFMGGEGGCWISCMYFSKQKPAVVIAPNTLLPNNCYTRCHLQQQGSLSGGAFTFYYFIWQLGFEPTLSVSLVQRCTVLLKQGSLRWICMPVPRLCPSEDCVGLFCCSFGFLGCVSCRN